MSTFVLKREYALAMPTSYVDINSDEMEYVDGGFYINANRSATLATYIRGALGLSGTALGLAAIEKKLVSSAATVLAKVTKALATTTGIVGIVVGTLVGLLATTNIVSFCVGIITADNKDKGVDMTWYGGGFGNFKYR